MNADKVKEIEESISDLQNQKIFAGKKIVLFGSSGVGTFVYSYLIQKNLDVEAFIDNNVSGGHSSGIPIFTPEQFFKKYKNGTFIILLCTIFKWSEMSTVLLGYGQRQNIDFFIILNEGWFSGRKLLFRDLLYETKKLFHAIKILKDYQKIYQCDGIVPFTFASIGDSYLIASALKHYFHQKEIHNPLILCKTKAQEKALKMYGFKKIELVNDTICRALVKLHLIGIDNGLIHPNGLWMYHYEGIAVFTYRNFHYNDIVAHAICGLEGKDAFEYPQIPRDEQYLSDVFERNNLIKGKTVVLFPYANTLQDNRIERYQVLAQQLIQQGYTVCTSVSNQSEVSVEGTRGIFIPLDQLVNFVEEAGYAVMVRSGISDILAYAHCIKIILYCVYTPRYDTVGYFSINRMFPGANAIEITDVLDISDEELVNRVLINIKK